MTRMVMMPPWLQILAVLGTYFRATGAFATLSRRHHRQPQSFSSRFSFLDRKQTNHLDQNGGGDLDWRKGLPAPLQQYKDTTFQKMQCVSLGDFLPINIYVLGTDHLLQDSAEHVKLLCETVHPDLLFVESCWTRHSINTTSMPGFGSMDEFIEAEDKNEWTKSSFYNQVERYPALLSLFLDMPPNRDQKAVCQYWEDQSMRPMLVLGDRPIEITQARYREAFTKWDNIRNKAPALLTLAAVGGTGWLLNRVRKVVGGFTMIALFGTLMILLGEKFAPFYKTNLKQTYEENSRSFLFKGPNDAKKRSEKEKPSTYNRVIIKERDIYMACKLFQSLCLLRQEGKSDNAQLEKNAYNVVVQVGAAHVPGMCDFFSNTVLPSQDPEKHLWPLVTTNTTVLPDNFVLSDEVEGIRLVNPTGS